MSGAASARETIRKVLEATYKPTFRAGRDYADAYQKAVAADDLVEALAHTVDLILAAEHLQKLADEAAKAARASLATTMEEVGCPQIASGHFSAHLHRKPVVLAIGDPKLIPPEYLIQPPPVPDRKQIRDVLETGKNVPGAALIIPNQMVLSIRSRSSK